MPLKLNVGLSRKVGEANFGSRGASVNVELELDSTLVADPAKFQERIRQLFGIVRTSLADELNGHSNGHANGNTQNGNGTHSAPAAPERPATQSQVKAIFAITKQQRINLEVLLRERFHINRPEDLSLKQASQLIDSLKNGGST